jgi:hypothetical protein
MALIISDANIQQVLVANKPNYPLFDYCKIVKKIFKPLPVLNFMQKALLQPNVFLTQ